MIVDLDLRFEERIRQICLFVFQRGQRGKAAELRLNLSMARRLRRQLDNAIRQAEQLETEGLVTSRSAHMHGGETLSLKRQQVLDTGEP